MAIMRHPALHHDCKVMVDNMLPQDILPPVWLDEGLDREWPRSGALFTIYHTATRHAVHSLASDSQNHLVTNTLSFTAHAGVKP